MLNDKYCAQKGKYFHQIKIYSQIQCKHNNIDHMYILYICFINNIIVFIIPDSIDDIVYDTDTVRDSDVDLAVFLLSDFSPDTASDDMGDVIAYGPSACVLTSDLFTANVDFSSLTDKSLIQDKIMDIKYVTKSKFFDDLKVLSADIKPTHSSTNGAFVDYLFAY